MVGLRKTPLRTHRLMHKHARRLLAAHGFCAPARALISAGGPETGPRHQRLNIVASRLVLGLLQELATTTFFGSAYALA